MQYIFFILGFVQDYFSYHKKLMAVNTFKCTYPSGRLLVIIFISIQLNHRKMIPCNSMPGLYRPRNKIMTGRRTVLHPFCAVGF